MRWPVAAILGCTGLPAFLLRPASTLPSAPTSTLASLMLLSVRERVLSEFVVELIVSSKLCTPKPLSLIIVLAIGVVCKLFSCADSESREVFLPLSALFSTSFSLRRKNVVGPEWPGLVSGGGPVPFFALTVRYCESCAELIVKISYG